MPFPVHAAIIPSRDLDVAQGRPPGGDHTAFLHASYRGPASGSLKNTMSPMRRLLRGVSSACTALALTVPNPAWASCPENAKERVADARLISTKAREHLENGAFAEAAAAFERAFSAHPECDQNHLRRLTALEETVSAHRQRFLEAPDERASVEHARDLVRSYLAELEAHYGPTANRQEGYTTASALLAQLDKDLESRSETEASTPEHTSDAAPLTPPHPASDEPRAMDTNPPRRRGLALGGGAMLSAGLAMLAVGIVGATRSPGLMSEFYDNCKPGERMGLCGELVEQGVAVNAMQLAGFTGAALLGGTGIALLVLSSRRRVKTRALVPALSPTFAGASWKVRF